MSTMTDEQVETLEFILDRIKQGTAGVLSDWERSFMQDQQTRYEEYGNQTRFSERQWNIVEKIESILIEGKPTPRRR